LILLKDEEYRSTNVIIGREGGEVWSTVGNPEEQLIRKPLIRFSPRFSGMFTKLLPSKKCIS